MIRVLYAPMKPGVLPSTRESYLQFFNAEIVAMMTSTSVATTAPGPATMMAIVAFFGRVTMSEVGPMRDQASSAVSITLGYVSVPYSTVIGTPTL
jgi:hypothetical protein